MDVTDCDPQEFVEEAWRRFQPLEACFLLVPLHERYISEWLETDPRCRQLWVLEASIGLPRERSFWIWDASDSSGIFRKATGFFEKAPRGGQEWKDAEAYAVEDATLDETWNGAPWAYQSLGIFDPSVRKVSFAYLPLKALRRRDTTPDQEGGLIPVNMVLGLMRTDSDRLSESAGRNAPFADLCEPGLKNQPLAKIREFILECGPGKVRRILIQGQKEQVRWTKTPTNGVPAGSQSDETLTPLGIVALAVAVLKEYFHIDSAFYLRSRDNQRFHLRPPCSINEEILQRRYFNDDEIIDKEARALWIDGKAAYEVKALRAPSHIPPDLGKEINFTTVAYVVFRFDEERGGEKEAELGQFLSTVAAKLAAGLRTTHAHEEAGFLKTLERFSYQFRKASARVRRSRSGSMLSNLTELGRHIFPGQASAQEETQTDPIERLMRECRLLLDVDAAAIYLHSGPLLEVTPGGQPISPALRARRCRFKRIWRGGKSGGLLNTEFVAGSNDDPKAAQENGGRGLTADVLICGRTLHVSDVERSPRWVKLGGQANDENPAAPVRAWVGVPLLVKGDDTPAEAYLFGAFMVVRSRKSRFGADDFSRWEVERIKQLADRVASLFYEHYWTLKQTLVHNFTSFGHDGKRQLEQLIESCTGTGNALPAAEDIGARLDVLYAFLVYHSGCDAKPLFPCTKGTFERDVRTVWAIASKRLKKNLADGMEWVFDDALEGYLINRVYLLVAMSLMVNNAVQKYADSRLRIGASNPIQIELARSTNAPALARLFVRDQGGVVAEENLLFLFEAHWTSKQGGSGLGLTLIRDMGKKSGEIHDRQQLRQPPKEKFWGGANRSDGKAGAVFWLDLLLEATKPRT